MEVLQNLILWGWADSQQHNSYRPYGVTAARLVLPGYVVDFYDGQHSATHPVSIHIDARPEVSIDGLRDRFLRWWG